MRGRLIFPLTVDLVQVDATGKAGPTLQVPAQVKSFDRAKVTQGQDDEVATLLFHLQTLEDMGLVDPATGLSLKPGDRIDVLRNPDGSPAEVLANAFVRDVSPLGFLDSSRNLISVSVAVRPYRTFVVRRIWRGEIVGEGGYVTVEREIYPRPRVARDADTYGLTPGGIAPEGMVQIREVSLAYRFDDLHPTADCPPNEQWFVRIDDASSVGAPSRWCVHASAPYVDHDVCWVLALKTVDMPAVE